MCVESCLTSGCLANIACDRVVIETTTTAVLLQLCVKKCVYLFPSVISFVDYPVLTAVYVYVYAGECSGIVSM